MAAAVAVRPSGKLQEEMALMGRGELISSESNSGAGAGSNDRALGMCRLVLHSTAGCRSRSLL